MGNTDCTSGEVQLLSTYLKVGVHNVGSFGTVGSLQNSTFYSDQLSVIADFDRNGFASTPTPGFSGDYFYPSAPVEGTSYYHAKFNLLPSMLICTYLFGVVVGAGWLFIYTKSDNTKSAKLAEGLMGEHGVLPSSILLTSSTTQQSMVWVGTSGSLEFKKVTQVSHNKLYIITTVVVKNVGTEAINELFCKISFAFRKTFN